MFRPWPSSTLLWLHPLGLLTESLQELRGVAHEANRLHDRLSFVRAEAYFLAVLTLVASDPINSGDAQEVLDLFVVPRRCILGVFVEKEPPTLNLLAVELTNKIEVLVCPTLFSGYDRGIPLGVVQVLPCSVYRAHGGADEEQWLLFPDHFKCPLTFACG